MKTSFIKGAEIESLLDKIHQIKIIEGQKVSYSSFESEIIKSSLLSQIVFDEKVPSESRRRIITQSIQYAALNNVKSQQDLLDVVKKFVSSYNSLKYKYYYVLTTITIRNLPFRKVNLFGSELRFTGQSFPKEFTKSRNLHFQKYYLQKERDDTCKVVIRSRAKNSGDAVQQAINCLDVFRGFLCILLNDAWQFRVGTRKPETPINKVLRGEFITVHSEDGATPEDPYWINTNYYEIKTYEMPNKSIKPIHEFLLKRIKKYNQLRPSLRTSLMEVYARFCDAYDQKNRYLAFVKSWSCLEMLTGESLINDATSFYKNANKEYAKNILIGLRAFRNEFVHTGSENIDPDIPCFLVQTYIKNILNFIFSECTQLENMTELKSLMKELRQSDKDLSQSLKIKKIAQRISP